MDMHVPKLLAQSSIFGTISPPPGVKEFNDKAGLATGNQTNIGLIVFISNIIRVATIVAGVWVLFNFILAGYTFITSQGDTNATNKVKDQITTSIQGLIIIVAAYTLIALISYFLFNDATYILSPTIKGPLDGQVGVPFDSTQVQNTKLQL